jgi:hypothetical protein
MKRASGHGDGRFDWRFSLRLFRAAEEWPLPLHGNWLAVKVPAGELLNSEIIGLWKDRDDIPDSPDHVRELRNTAH